MPKSSENQDVLSKTTQNAAVSSQNAWTVLTDQHKYNSESKTAVQYPSILVWHTQISLSFSNENFQFI
ncbi:hypothetical protein HUJ04_007862 [Dendroctonus ponderosae]|nr:hypothetical protein HUJ04_007862 [Dendroctonus ponderosae]